MSRSRVWLRSSCVSTGSRAERHPDRRDCRADIDYTGWTPDGTFRFFDTWSSFADLQSRSPFENHGQILSSQIFQRGLGFAPNYTIFWAPKGVTLHPNSNAIDAGLVNTQHHRRIHRERVGSGSLERGAPIPTYGVRLDVPSSAPTGRALQ